MPDIVLIKLGGSLIDSPHLGGWLKATLAAAGCARLVVPGGGPFADAIRSLQPQFGFSDQVAHGMAILAMQQYALLLQAREPRLALVESEDELAALCATGTAGIWLPWRLAGREPALAASWEVTSDSMALWLAQRLAATGVIVVKRGSVPACGTASAALASGLVDAAFGRFLEGCSFPVHIVCEQAHGRLAALVQGMCQQREGRK